MSETAEFEQEVRRIAALADPVRHELYRFVVGRSDPVSREEAATAVGIPVHTAKFHLDKLVGEGLMDTEFRRLTNRSGPGAGRPAKLYRRSDRTVSVSLPERNYELAAELLASSVARSAQAGTSVSDALQRTARETGRHIGEQVSTDGSRRRSAAAHAASVCRALAQCGYEPELHGTSIALRNCPFHNLARTHTDLVCGMNLDLLRGLLEGMSMQTASARLEPSPERCCVRVDIR